MRAIIILSLFAATSLFAQQQQQQRYEQQNVLINNRGNVYVSNVSLNNIQINTNDNVLKQQVVRNVARVSPARRYTQVKASNTSKTPTPQVRRRARPRPVNATRRVVSQPQVINVPTTNEVLNASNINTPAQNIILPNNIDVQTQGFSNVVNEDVNVSIQQEGNKVSPALNVDLSLNLKGKTITRTRSSAASSSSSSSHSRTHSFNKKMAKFKRHFFGKLASHKKGNHRLDMCFNWKH